MKRKKLMPLVVLSFLVVALSSVFCAPAAFAEETSRDTSWVPTEGSYAVENSMLKLQSDSGFNLQGNETIVDGFNKMQAGNPDFIWYGEYEYMSIDGGANWIQLPNVRTLTEVTAGQEYIISFVTAGTNLTGISIDKRVTIVTGPDEPLARIEYSVRSGMQNMSAMIYYAIDYCDYQTTADANDNVYDFTNTQILTSQWITGVYGLYVDTLASGFGVIETTYLADYYAGTYNDAIYMIWDIGDNIDTNDDGIGVRIDLGVLPLNQTVVKDLYIGVYQAGEPPEPIEEHDVEAFWQSADKVEVLPGELIDIQVVVTNNGDVIESFDVTCTADGITIGTIRAFDVVPGEHRTLIFTWDTTGVPQGVYAITAFADSSAEIVEVDETNNECTVPSDIFVVPELPLGTILASLSMFGALVGYVGFKRHRTK